MKIIYLIGNGFDLNLGLNTSYKDFYEYYISAKSSSKNISDLKRDISNDYKNWALMELALGQYTNELKSLNDFDEVFEDIGQELANYLKMEESKFESILFDKEEFFRNLAKPEFFLSPIERDQLSSYKSKFIKSHWVLDIVTFNYTSIIEKIVGDVNNINIGHHPTNMLNITLRSVLHIHGYVNDRMVLGVNDLTQLKNKDFHNDVDVLEAIVKEKCNNAYGHKINNEVKNKISYSDLICIFGSSMGDTDNMWWELIGERLKNSSVKIIIFTKGEEAISPRIGYKTNRTKRKMSKYFFKKTKLNKEEIEKVSENVYVAIDTRMFKQLIKELSPSTSTKA